MKLFKNLFKPKWQNSDTTVRKQAIVALDANENQAILKDIATSDNDVDLRLIALKRISDLETISQISAHSSESKVQELGDKLLKQVLSGQRESTLDDSQKIEKLQQINRQSLYEFIAENGNSAALRKTAIGNTTRESLLGNLAISDKDTDIRSAAANKLSQKSTLERVFRATKTKDKNVSRIVKEKLDSLLSEAEKPALLLATQKQICNNLESLGSKGLWERDKFQFDSYIKQWVTLEENDTLTLQSRYEEAKNKFSHAYDDYLIRQEARLSEEATFLPIKEEKQAIIQMLQTQVSELKSDQNLPEETLINMRNTSNEKEAHWHQLETLPQDLEEEIRTQFDDALKTIKNEIKRQLHGLRLFGSLDKLNKDIKQHIKQPFKLTEQVLAKFEKQMSKLNSGELVEANQKLQQDIKNQLNQAADMINKQKTRMTTLATETSTHLDKIDNFLKEGILKEASQLRKTVQSNIKEMEKFGFVNIQNLHHRLNESSKQINELSNWRSWANTPQKEQLIKKIEALIDSELDPKEIAYIISHARNDWKNLGPSEKDSSQKQWESFQSACEKAYEPCKAHFANEAIVFEENLLQRTKFLDDLNSFLAQANWESIDWKKVENLFRHARNEWQALGLVDKKKRKDLNKRFYALFNQLKNELNKEWDKNLLVKAEIVTEAKNLSQIEDLKEAIDAAKSLQQKWKKAGRIQHIKERELWAEFKQASDAVFSRREDENKQKEQEEQQQVEKKALLVKAIEEFCNKTPIEIGNEKSTFNQLKTDLKNFGKTNSKADEAIEKRLLIALDIFERKIEALDKFQVVIDLQRLRKKSDICNQLENSIDANQSINTEEFTKKIEAVEPINQADWNQRINQRFQTLLDFTKQNDANSLLSKEAEKHREQKNLVAVQLEIIADIETPQGAANERLKAQTQRLSDRLQNRAEENQWDSFLSAEVNWLTLGPVSSEDSETLNKRHNNVIKALRTEYPEELKDY